MLRGRQLLHAERRANNQRNFGDIVPPPQSIMAAAVEGKGRRRRTLLRRAARSSAGRGRTAMFFTELRAILKVGVREYVKQVWYLSSYIGGSMVGRDGYGNEYYAVDEHAHLPFCKPPPPPSGRTVFIITRAAASRLDRKRYVILKDHSEDPSNVPADWHGWLHYTHDDAPSTAGSKFHHPPWEARHQANLTGGDDRYVPYSTTTPKVFPFARQCAPLKLAAFLQSNRALLQMVPPPAGGTTSLTAGGPPPAAPPQNGPLL